MLLQRIISALVGVPLIVLAVWQAGIPLLLLTGIIVFLGLREMSEMLSRLGIKPSFWLAQAGGLILLGGAYLYHDGYPGPTITIILFLELIAIVAFYPRYSLLDIAGTLMGTLYVGLMCYFYLISTLPDGGTWLIFMFACTWASDTFAFFIGKAFGRKRIAPVISPKKTLEGASGGLLGSVIIAYLFGIVYPFLPLPKLLLLGFMLGIAAGVGDLLESAFKRQAGLKDSSALIPGHGGILDRFDSALFTAPLVYYFVRLFIIG
ncbi:phosphatidate cytidylyltransferase [Pelotomaculum terephthalicicum JT]|uniref:phosphatidate cytidylyltransferase n=1 Tax=Pelotomaculum TaxID=191373 RepID=UPI0009D1E3B5|nr:MULTISPECIES: phosphatidate cytidylyltransferase [Pelotomaculum]MCG9967775.1 phosphatidate cytidylyltransferase [Pelotomaculum terephthalicicum JT]OPX85393.1 MAG: Phosphatidate cytidylyltransferase [Pelotomaculum sp. PtaB.Bin117]